MNEELSARRAEALRRLLNVADAHDLPVPMNITLLAGIVSIRLDDDSRGEVTLWANALNLELVVDRRITDFTAVRAGRSFQSDDLWRGWDHVEIWSACDMKRPTGGDVA